MVAQSVHFMHQITSGLMGRSEHWSALLQPLSFTLIIWCCYCPAVLTSTPAGTETQKKGQMQHSGDRLMPNDVERLGFRFEDPVIFVKSGSFIRTAATWLFGVAAPVLTSSVISPLSSTNIILVTQALLYFNPTSSLGIISHLSVQMRGTLLDPRRPRGAAKDSTPTPRCCSPGSHWSLILLWLAPWKVIFHLSQQQQAGFYMNLKINQFV